MVVRSLFVLAWLVVNDVAIMLSNVMQPNAEFGLNTSRRPSARRLSVEFVARRSERRPVRLQPGHQPADWLHELLPQGIQQ
jgi:hypothetical protein